MKLLCAHCYCYTFAQQCGNASKRISSVFQPLLCAHCGELSMTSELKEGLSESRPMEEKEFLWLRHDPNWLLAMDFYRMAAIMQ